MHIGSRRSRETTLFIPVFCALGQSSKSARPGHEPAAGQISRPLLSSSLFFLSPPSVFSSTLLSPRPPLSFPFLSSPLSLPFLPPGFLVSLFSPRPSFSIYLLLSFSLPLSSSSGLAPHPPSSLSFLLSTSLSGSPLFSQRPSPSWSVVHPHRSLRLTPRRRAA